jgi:hypothetical protein
MVVIWALELALQQPVLVHGNALSGQVSAVEGVPAEAFVR